MHPFFSQPGFNPPTGNFEGLQMEANDSGIDVYETPPISGLLLQNAAYMVETNTRFDRPLRCELFDPKVHSRSLELNIMDTALRCMVCGERMERITVPTSFPNISISNEKCSATESCRMRCACEPSKVVDMQMTLVPIQTHETHFCQDYELTLPSNSNFRWEHVFRVPVESVRQNMSCIHLESDATKRRFHHTMHFDDVGMSHVYETPFDTTFLGVDITDDGALRNTFVLKNETESAAVIGVRVYSAHLFETTFADSVRYFQSLYTTTFSNERPDILAEHISEWRLVRSRIDIVFHADLSEKQLREEVVCTNIMTVSLFESLMTFHDIDEDDAVSVPILTLMRPKQARRLLELRIKRLDRDLPRRIGYAGAAVRWKESEISFWKRDSAQRIYRNALLIIHIWNYFRHTADYTWLQIIGYPAMHSCAMFISEFRYKDPGTSKIRFRNVKNTAGVTVDNDLFTNRICALALTYASTAAWKLNFKHQLIWEKYHLRESDEDIDLGESAIPPEIFDATDKNLLLDVEMIKGMFTYVFHWLENVEGEIRTHRIGYRFGDSSNRYILVNSGTTLIQSQLVRSTYSVMLTNQYGQTITISENERAISLYEIRSYELVHIRSYELFVTTRMEFCQEFGMNAIISNSMSLISSNKLDPTQIDNYVSISLASPYTYNDETTPIETLHSAVNDHLLSNDPNMLINMIATLGHMQSRSNVAERWRYINSAFNCLLNGKYSSSHIMFGFLFGIMKFEFKGDTSSKGADFDVYATECNNNRLLPFIFRSVDLQNISELTVTVRNDLFKNFLFTLPLLYKIRYHPEIESVPSKFEIEFNAEATGIDTFSYTSQNVFTADGMSIVEGTNYATSQNLFIQILQMFSVRVSVFFTITINDQILLYDHDFARASPLPNGSGTLQYIFDNLEGNAVRTTVSLNTLDQTAYLLVPKCTLELKFQPIFRKITIYNLLNNTTTHSNIEGVSDLEHSFTSSVCGNNVDVLQITMFVVPEREFLLQYSPPFVYVNVKLLDNTDNSVIPYHDSKRMRMDQSTPPFVTYAPPTIRGQIDTRVFFDASQVPGSPKAVGAMSWYAMDLDSETPQTPQSIPEVSLSDSNTPASYSVLFDVGAQSLTLYSIVDPVRFEEDFGSTVESVQLALNEHVQMQPEFPILWFRAFNTHIILCHSNYTVYAIGTHVNFYRMTNSRRIVLQEVEELESLRIQISPAEGRILTDVHEGMHGDSLRFAIRSEQNTLWWGIGTNYYNTLGTSAYDPLVHDLVEGTASVRNVEEELTYLEIMNDKIDMGYHRAEAVVPLQENRADEIVVYDKIDREVHVLGGCFAPRNWRSVALIDPLLSNNIESVLYDNVRKRLLIGTTVP